MQERFGSPSRITQDAGRFVACLIGWGTVDLSMAATSSEPNVALDFLPGYVGLLLVGSVIGALCGLAPRASWLLFGLTVLAAVAPKFYAVPVDLTRQLIFLPRAIALLLVAFLASRLVAHDRTAALATSVGLGAIAASAFAIYLNEVSSFSLSAAIAGSLLVASSALKQRRARRVACLATGFVCLTLVAAFAVHKGQLRRADRPRPIAESTVAVGPNLILIVLDSVSAHHLAPYGYPRVTTPGLDAFVRDYAVQYTQARSVTSWTLPSHASLFTGLHPAQHGADHPRRAAPDGPPSGSAPEHAAFEWPADPLRSDVTTLAERAGAVGYQTGAIVANCGYLSHTFGLDRGFEYYDDRCGARMPSLLLLQLAGFQLELGGKTRTAETISDLAIEWLEAPERRRPFFLFLNYMDAHAPYLPPPPYDRLFSEEQPRDPLKPEQELNSLLYDRELAYLDAQVTRLLRILEARSLLAGTAIVITSDHGEAFGEHDVWGHDRFLYEKLIRVPLYVKPSGPRHAAVSDRMVTTPDVYRLVLAELGLPDPSPPTASAPSAEWYRSEAITAAAEAQRDTPERLDRDLLVWLDGNVKWIVSSAGAVQAHDVLEDPEELRPLDLSHERIEQARARSRAWWDSNAPLSPDAHRSRPLDPAVVERLRNLGYID